MNFSSIKPFLLILLLLFTACKEEIVHNLSEYDANKLITSLHYAGIDSEKERQADGKWAIKVPTDSSVLALTHLDNLRFFKRTDSKKNKKSSMMSSREEQRFQFERSLSSTIEATLSTLSGVLDARVHLNLPVSDPLFGQQLDSKEKGTASVLLITDLDFPNTDNQIASLVSGASGIPADKVSVLVSKPVSESDEAQEKQIALEVKELSEHQEELFTPFIEKPEPLAASAGNEEFSSTKSAVQNYLPKIEPEKPFKFWAIIFGGLCFLGLVLKLFFQPKRLNLQTKAKKPDFNLKGIKPHDLTNAVRNTAK